MSTCTHTVMLQTGGWTRCADSDSPYYGLWVHADPDCMRPRFIPQYVRVEVDEGRAYTYTWHGETPLEKGEWVSLPGNEMRPETFAGKVIRVLDGPDPNYSGDYKPILGRVL